MRSKQEMIYVIFRWLISLALEVDRTTVTAPTGEMDRNGVFGAGILNICWRASRRLRSEVFGVPALGYLKPAYPCSNLLRPFVFAR